MDSALKDRGNTIIEAQRSVRDSLSESTPPWHPPVIGGFFAFIVGNPAGIRPVRRPKARTLVNVCENVGSTRTPRHPRVLISSYMRMPGFPSAHKRSERTQTVE